MAYTTPARPDPPAVYLNSSSPADAPPPRLRVVDLAADALAGTGAGLLAASLLWALAPSAPTVLAVGLFGVSALAGTAAAGAARHWWRG